MDREHLSKLLKLFECPSCYGYLHKGNAIIFQCESYAHKVCSECYLNLYPEFLCPICRSKLRWGKRMMQILAEAIPLPCMNEDEGCLEVFYLNDPEQLHHERDACTFREIPCPGKFKFIKPSFVKKN